MNDNDRPFLLLAIVAGLVLGVLTPAGPALSAGRRAAVGQRDLAVAGRGLRARSQRARAAIAAVSGWIALTLALVAYYAMVWLQFGYGGSTGALIVWAVAALAGGLVFGPAGWAWRHSGPRLAAAAVGLLTAAFIAEAIYVYQVVQPESRPATAIFAAVGLAIPVVLGRSMRERVLAYAAILPSLALAAAGYAAMLAFGSLAAGL